MDTNKNTILIVDDEPMVRNTIERLLSRQGYNTVTAPNGNDALGKMANIMPDLVLLDIVMPGPDGFEVCRRIKANNLWRHIPVIIITGLDSTEDMVRGLDAGAEDFLPKPVKFPELQARVRSMLRIKNQYDALEKQRRELESSLKLNRRTSRVFAQHLEALEVLHDTGLRLMDNLNMNSVLDLISLTALDLVPEAAGCIIHFLSDESEQLLPMVFSAETKTKIIHPTLGIELIINKVIATGQHTYLADITTDAPQLQPQLPDMRALLVIPLTDSQRSAGTLSVYSPEAGVFQENNTHVLSILANQAAIAISNARFFQERALTKEKEKRVIRNLFQRYVSPAVVDRLVDGQENLGLGGKRQEVTVLFADIRGFSSFSEKLPPESVVDALNQYLGLAVEAIMAQEGTLDKFMGDAVMALFNAPLPQADCTLRAVRAALNMQQAIAMYNQEATNKYRLNFGIGIHFAQAVVGNIGTTQQMNYTAIGDTVNLAKRLQENAKGGQILLSKTAYQAVKEMVTVDSLGSLEVKGRKAAEEVYAVVDIKEPIPTAIPN